MATRDPVEAAEDGRTARRDRNREAVLDAALDLLAERCRVPSAQEVADRSGVSMRSVYRYYDDREELVRSAIARNLERFGGMFEVDELGRGPQDERIARLVSARLELYEAIAPTARAAMLLARSNELVRARVDDRRRLLLDQVERMFEPELRRRSPAARREVAAAIDVLLGFEGIELLRVERRFSVDQTRRTLRRAVRALLDA